MKKGLKALIVLGLFGFVVQAHCLEKSETVTVPWTQFKELYREHLKKELAKQIEPVKKKVVPIALTNCDCKVVFSKKLCLISYKIKGLRGNIDKEPLLKKNYAVISSKTDGGVRLQRFPEGIGLLLTAEKKLEFLTEFTVSVPVKVVDGDYLVELEIPNSLTNVVTVEFRDDLRLGSFPADKIDGRKNIFSVAPGVFDLRAVDSNVKKVKWFPDLDIFTNYKFGVNRMQLQIKALVNPGSSRAFCLKLSAGIRCSRGALPRFIRVDSSGELNVNLPEKVNNFTVTCETDLKPQVEQVTVKQPFVPGNRGREGFFALAQPLGAEVAVAAKGLQRDLFPADITAAGAGTLSCWSSPVSNPLTFTIKKLNKVSSPEVIVETIFFCSALEENGSIISSLSFEYPGSGALKLKKLTDGKLWRFTINGKKSGIYEDGKYWRVELPAEHKTNRVEMAFLLTGKKPGIQGIYSSTMPDCGLNARRVVYTAVLPKRLELRGFEGGIDPLPKDIAPPHLPRGISGNRYNFYRPYYTGGEIKAEFFYREPPENK